VSWSLAFLLVGVAMLFSSLVRSVRVFFVRVLLSVWVVTPFGRGCGSLRRVWSDAPLSVWGGAAPSSVLSLSDAWVLLRRFSVFGSDFPRGR